MKGARCWFQNPGVDFLEIWVSSLAYPGLGRAIIRPDTQKKIPELELGRRGFRPVVNALTAPECQDPKPQHLG